MILKIINQALQYAEAIRNIALAPFERLPEEHTVELRMTEIAKGCLSKNESSRTLAIKTLQEEHAAAFASKDLAFTEEIEL